MLAFYALIVFILALLLFWQSGRQTKAAGLPGGRLIYADTTRWGKLEEPLYDAESGLSGKPDYLIEKGREIIPVEVKSSRPPIGPYDSHIFQLAAYCLLVQQVYGVRPPYGILHYDSPDHQSRTFAVDYTPELERQVTLLLAEMRLQEKRTDVPRSHQASARCKGCGFRTICDQRLV